MVANVSDDGEEEAVPFLRGMTGYSCDVTEVPTGGTMYKHVQYMNSRRQTPGTHRRPTGTPSTELSQSVKCEINKKA